MMNIRTLSAATCLIAAQVAMAADHDYPTHERVMYAIQCINRHGGAQDLLYKCSCAIDRIAQQYSYDEFVDMQTAANALTMTGERGGELRDSSVVRSGAKLYRQSESAALQSCGIAPKQ
jgi:hypothetical protein